jgi:hypothetical protein
MGFSLWWEQDILGYDRFGYKKLPQAPEKVQHNLFIMQKPRAERYS